MYSYVLYVATKLHIAIAISLIPKNIIQLDQSRRVYGCYAVGILQPVCEGELYNDRGY